MKRYAALDGRGRSIITVVASDEQEAAERIREQLERPGRRFYLAQWLEGGATVKEKTTSPEPGSRGGGSQ
jgi:hypothetical protein